MIKDNTADHITTEEARQLIDDLNNSLGMDGLRFVTGMGYRHLLIWDNGPVDTITTPPHDVPDQPVQTYLPKGNRHDEVIKLMEESKRILSNHPVNQVRIKAGKNAATQIWLWGQGRKTFLPSYQKMYGLTGSVISAVDLVKGIGLLAGLKAVQVPGATGFIDTDFAGKVKAAMDVLSEHDFVFVHVEAPDECSHMGNLNLKIKAMEAFDREIVGPIWQCLQTRGEAYRLVIGTDHRTPVVRRCHTAEPVPIALLEGPVSPTNAEAQFDEFVNGGHVSGMAFELLQTVLKR